MTVVHAPLLNRVDRLGAAIGVAVTLGWLVLVGPWAGLSAGLGVLLGGANFIALRRITARLLAPDQSARSASHAAGVLMMKFAAAGLVVFVLIVWVEVDARAFAAGLTSVVIALVVESLRRPDLAGLATGLGTSAPSADKGIP